MNVTKTEAAEKIVPKRAATAEEIRPLIEMCRSGRLFDVQVWIAEGKPVNVPMRVEKRSKLKAPLEEAMESGFHSLVQVLLQAGGVTHVSPGWERMEPWLGRSISPSECAAPTL